MYGPKGVGAIYIRRRPRVRIEPILSGGGQERGLRSGTVATPLAVGVGAACEVALREMASDTAHVRRLSARLMEKLSSRLTHLVLNGDPEKRYPGNLNVSFAYVEGESLLMGLKEIAVSSGSACTSASLEPSYVLRALGVDDELAHTSLRFGIGCVRSEAALICPPPPAARVASPFPRAPPPERTGCARPPPRRFTTEEEVDLAVEQTVAHVEKLREMSPLWEMVRPPGDPLRAPPRRLSAAGGQQAEARARWGGPAPAGARGDRPEVHKLGPALRASARAAVAGGAAAAAAVPPQHHQPPPGEEGGGQPLQPPQAPSARAGCW